jgi:hypothetical protein
VHSTRNQQSNATFQKRDILTTRLRTILRFYEGDEVEIMLGVKRRMSGRKKSRIYKNRIEVEAVGRWGERAEHSEICWPRRVGKARASARGNVGFV